jgi:hypothetical protein
MSPFNEDYDDVLPYAIDCYDNVYLLHENVIVLKKSPKVHGVVFQATLSDEAMVHDSYLDVKRITTLCTAARDSLFDDHSIRKFFIDDSEWCLEWTNDPYKEYEFFMKFNDTISVQLAHSDQLITWSLSDYVKNIKEFGEKAGLEKLDIIKASTENATNSY